MKIKETYLIVSMTSVAPSLPSYKIQTAFNLSQQWFSAWFISQACTWKKGKLRTNVYWSNLQKARTEDDKGHVYTTGSAPTGLWSLSSFSILSFRDFYSPFDNQKLKFIIRTFPISFFTSWPRSSVGRKPPMNTWDVNE